MGNNDSIVQAILNHSQDPEQEEQRIVVLGSDNLTSDLLENANVIFDSHNEDNIDKFAKLLISSQIEREGDH